MSASPLIATLASTGGSTGETAFPLIGLVQGEVGCVLGALLVLLALAIPVFRRVALPAHGPRTLDVPNDVDPALASYLLHPAEVPGEAVTATVIDLAARGALEMVAMGGSQTGVRVTGRALTGLQPHEQSVLDLVRAQVGADGLAPAQALSSDGPRRAGWKADFDTSIRKRAAADGFTRSRYGREVGFAALLVLGVTAGIVLWSLPGLQGVYGGGLRRDAPVDSAPISTVPQGYLRFGVELGTIGLLALALILLFRLFGGTEQRLTSSGSARASTLLGLADHLGADEQFRNAEPGAVAIWGRLLAFATGFGVATTVFQQLPMGPESSTRAWSDVSGRWRLVRVVYSEGFCDSRGLAPALLMKLGAKNLLRVAFYFGVPGYAIFAARHTIADVIRDEHVSARHLPWEVYLVAIPLVIILLPIVGGLFRLSLGATGAFASHDDVTGTAVRVRVAPGGPTHGSGHWIAVDDGTADVVHAYRSFTSTRPHQGEKVHLRVRRLVQQVESLTVDNSLAVAEPSAAAAQTV